MADPFIGEIRMCGFNFAPRNWAACDGALIPIQQNPTLYALLGTQFGGDGRTDFALPDMRGRVPVHPGNSYDGMVRQGDLYGVESVAINNSTMPAHTHMVRANDDPADSKTPEGCYPGAPTIVQGSIYDVSDTLNVMAPQSISTVGAGQGHNNMQPSLAINFIIALEGIFPPRN